MLAAVPMRGLCRERRKGIGVELHSEGESFRKAHVLRAPDGSAATLLVLRRRTFVWLTFSGAEKTSVTMSVAETDDVIDTLSAARGGKR
jgi:hypothetical protein